MFKKIKEKRMQKKYEQLVGRLSDERGAFENAVNASENLSEHDKIELIKFYWDSIYSEIRFQRLESLYYYIEFEHGIIYGILFIFAALLFGYVSGGI